MACCRFGLILGWQLSKLILIQPVTKELAMSRLPHLFASTCLATCLAASPILADVSALEVWDNWQALLDKTGSTVSFEQSISGGILTINNLVLAGKDHEGSDIQAKFGSLVLQEKDDGSVIVLLPNDAPIVLITAKEQLTINQRHKEMFVKISGTDTDMTYNYNAKMLAFTLVELITDGAVVGGIQGDVNIVGLVGQIRNQWGDLNKTTQDISVDSVSYSLDFAPDTLTAVGASKGALSNLRANFEIALPENLKDLEIGEAVKAGLMVNARLVYGEYTSDMDFQEHGEAVKISLGSKTGEINLALDQGSVTPIDISQHISLGATRVHVTTDNLDGDIDMDLDLTLDRFTGKFTAAVPDVFKDGEASESNLSEALDANFQVLANIGYEGLNGDFSHSQHGENTSGSLTSGSSHLNAAFDRQALSYSANTHDTQISVNSAKLPGDPIGISASEFSTTLSMPVAISKTPSPFLYKDRYVDVKISENLWALFDPKKMLPHGPATYILDISGTGNWLVDLFDEQSHLDRGKAPKGELHSLEINDLKLNGVGVDISGHGDFTFNNDDLETYDGFPAPTGSLDLKLTGVNQLIDTLIEMGLLPKDQALAARMGLGLFTIAGDGKDELISHIESTDEGHVLANGKRLK